MARKARLLFVLNEQLGWTTYSRQFKRMLESRDDFEWEVLHPVTSGLSRSLLKRHNLTGYGRWLRQIDPLTAYEGYLGRPVRDAVERFKPDFVHFAAHLPAASLGAMRGAPPYTVALDSTRRNMDGFRDRRVWSDSDYAREAHLLRQAVLAFPLSEWTRQSMIKDYGVAADRIVIVGPSVDSAIIGVRDPALRASGPRKVIFIGNDFHRKGGHHLLEWFKGPLAGLAELHIVSRDPAVAGLNIPGVVVHGMVKHPELVGSLLPGMDILCHPTQSDMSAWVVTEASFAAVPSVASSVGGIPDLIRHGETGWCLDRNDHEGFVTTLRDLIADPDRVTAAGKLARPFAQANFDSALTYASVADRVKALALSGM